MNSGVYKITNVSTRRAYVGQAVDMLARWKKHKTQLRSKSHHSIALQRSWDRYGESDFTFEVVEYLPKSAWMLTRREQHHMDHAGVPLLNSSLVAGRGSRLGSTHSEETRKKLSQLLRGRVVSAEGRRNISIAQTGHTLSEESRKKISRANTGRKDSPETTMRRSKAKKGIPLSEEHRRKLSESQIGKTMPPMTDEHRAKISRANTGLIRTVETREKMSSAQTGHIVSEATRAKLSAANKGKVLSEAAKQKLRDRVVSEETKAKMSAAQWARRNK